MHWRLRTRCAQAWIQSRDERSSVAPKCLPIVTRPSNHPSTAFFRILVEERTSSANLFLAALTSAGQHEVLLDATLLSRLLQRDVSAFEQLYERHSRLVYGLVL